jgi:hypothetical protein
LRGKYDWIFCVISISTITTDRFVICISIFVLIAPLHSHFFIEFSKFDPALRESIPMLFPRESLFLDCCWLPVLEIAEMRNRFDDVKSGKSE